MLKSYVWWWWGGVGGLWDFSIERQRGAISCLLRRSVTEVRAMHSFSLDG